MKLNYIILTITYFVDIYPIGRKSLIEFRVIFTILELNINKVNLLINPGRKSAFGSSLWPDRRWAPPPEQAGYSSSFENLSETAMFRY